MECEIDEMRAQEGKGSYIFGSSVENSKTTAAIQATRQTTPVYKLLSQMVVWEEESKEAHPDKQICPARTSPMRIVWRVADTYVRYF